MKFFSNLRANWHEKMSWKGNIPKWTVIWVSPLLPPASVEGTLEPLSLKPAHSSSHRTSLWTCGTFDFSLLIFHNAMVSRFPYLDRSFKAVLAGLHLSAHAPHTCVLQSSGSQPFGPHGPPMVCRSPVGDHCSRVHSFPGPAAIVYLAGKRWSLCFVWLRSLNVVYVLWFSEVGGPCEG